MRRVVRGRPDSVSVGGWGRRRVGSLGKCGGTGQCVCGGDYEMTGQCQCACGGGVGDDRTVGGDKFLDWT